MAVPLSVSGVGGPYDLILSVGDEAMGFLTAKPLQVKQVSTFAPSIRVGGTPEYSHDSYQQLSLEGFDGGGDKDVLESGERRYQWSDGQVAMQVEKRVTLASEWEESDADIDAEGREILDFNASTCPQPWIVVAADNPRAFNTTTEVWGDMFSSGGCSEFYFLANDQYLFMSYEVSGTRYGYRWDGSGLAGAGYTALGGVGASCRCFGWFEESLYCSSGTNIYKATSGTGAAWGSAIPVGYPGTTVTDLYTSNGLLFIAKPEGLFVYDGASVYMILDAKTTYTTNSFRGLCDWLGAIYLPWMNALHKGAVTSATKMTNTDITPRMKGDTNKEIYGHGTPIKCIGAPHRMFIAFDDGESVYPEVLSYNGVGFQQIYRGDSGDTMYAMGYSREMGWLVINDGSTRIKRMINTGDMEYPDYAESGEFWTPAIDGGFPGEKKAFRSIELEIEDGVSEDEYLDVYYRLDGGAWVLVDSPYESGELVLNEEDGHVTGKKIEFRFILHRGSTVTNTPKLVMPILVRMMVIPDAIDAYSCVIVAKLGELLNGSYGALSESGNTVQDMIDFLNDARNSTYPVFITDEMNRTFVTKITDKSEQWSRLNDRGSELFAEVAMGFLDLAPEVNSTWVMTFTSNAADSATLNPSITLSAGAPTPEWTFVDPDGTSTTYSSSSPSHTVSGSGTTTFTLGPLELFEYITDIDFSDLSLTSTFSGLYMRRLVNVETFDFSDNASWQSSFALSDLPGSLTNLDCNSSGGSITGDLDDLPSSIEYIELPSGSNITGSLSDLPTTLTWLSLSTATTLITGTLSDLPSSLTLLLINDDGTTITGAAADMPSTMTYLNLATTSSVISGNISDLPSGLRHLYLYETSSTLSGAVADLPSTLINMNLYQSSCVVSGDFADLPTSIVQFTISETSSTATGEVTDLPSGIYGFNISDTSCTIDGDLDELPSTVTSLNVYSTGSSIGGGDSAISAVAIEEIIVYSTGMVAAECDELLLRLYTDRALFTHATPELYIGGTNENPTGIYQDGDPPTTGLEYVYELENDPETEGFNVWAIDY